MAKTFEDWIKLDVIGRLEKGDHVLYSDFHRCWHAAQAAQRERDAEIAEETSKRCRDIASDLPKSSNNVEIFLWQSDGAKKVHAAILADTGEGG